MRYDLERVKVLGEALSFWAEAVIYWEGAATVQDTTELTAYRESMLDAARTNFNYYLTELKAFRVLE